MQLALGVLLVYVLRLVRLQVGGGWPRVFVALNLVCLIVLAAYVVILFAGPSLDTKSGRELQVAAQKAIVYSSIVNLGLQALGVRRSAVRAR